MAQSMICSIFLILWLAGHVSADGGDDFANNLASDLGPIIALFGERVVMQFMSQAMGIADCILLAVAPIGAITTVVSAIRVSGPAWLKSFIGRARENLSAAEIDIMSSTSKEACELWNGQSVVRCPGSADIYQFICLMPKKYSIKELSKMRPKVRCRTLKDVANEKGGLLQKKEKTGPSYALNGLKKHVNLFTDEGFCRNLHTWFTSLLPHHLWEGEHNVSSPENSELEAGTLYEHTPITGILTGTDIPESTKSGSQSVNVHSLLSTDPDRDSKGNDEKEITIVVDNYDDSAPNLLLNCHDRVGRAEIYLAAAFGAILQLGALVYFGLITYHRSIQGKFLKDGKRPVHYAFPCAAIGTVLLVAGLFLCSWVVGESTTETYYEAEKHHIFLVWLQKNHTVSDQVFKPHVIYPTSTRSYITFSRRKKPQHNRELRHVVMHYKGKIGKKSTKDQDADQQNQENNETWDWPLKFITFIGALISLIGFVSQFIGMRGLNWTASVVQLGVTIVVTILRVIVRRGLAQSPIYKSLKSDSELDWFSLSVGHLARAPWATFEGKDKHGDNDDDKSVEKRVSRWKIRTGDQKPYPALTILSWDTKKLEESSTAHNILVTRQKLGHFSQWQSLLSEEAACLSGAVEAVANALLETLPIDMRTNKYGWTIPATYGNQNDDIYIELFKENATWKVDHERIEAILSLWLYSIQRAKFSETNRRRCLRLYGPSRLKKRLYRDLGWWMPEVIPEISTLKRSEIDKEMRKCTVVGFLSDSIKASNSVNENETFLVVECQDQQERLFARDLLFSFIRAVAQIPEVTITGASSIDQTDYSKMTHNWDQMKLRNKTIANLAINLERIGFGTTSDIYFDLIVPLSLEQKLANIKDTIDEATKQAQEYELSYKWKKLVNTCLCLLDLALRFDLEKECSGPLAIAVCLEFLCRLRHEASLQFSEGRADNILEEQVEILEKVLKEKKVLENEKLINPTLFSESGRTSRYNERHDLMSFSSLIGTIYDSNRDPPASFQVTDQHKKVLECEPEQVLYFKQLDELSKTDAFSWSPLHYAANMHFHNIYIDSTLEVDFDFLNCQDLMGWTPLQHACLRGNKKVVGMLLDRGALIEIAGNDGITPIHCAVRSENTEILKKLIETPGSRGLGQGDRNKRHPIHWAAVQGQVEMVQMLKDDIGLTDRFGWTALHLAAIYGHEKLLEYILESGVVNIDMGDENSHTPLHLAVESKSLAAVGVLLHFGAHVNARANNGSTPLHMAIPQSDIVRMLLEFGADINATDSEGRTPLHLAATNGANEVATLLMDSGANVKTAAEDGRTPLHMVLSHGVDGFVIARNMLQRGAYAQTTGKDGATPLHIASETGPSEAVELLINAGVDVDARDQYGQTPLLIAIYSCEWEIVKLLLGAGADVKADKRAGYTPLLGAVYGGKEYLLQHLLKAEVDVNAVDEGGDSPLHIAVGNDHEGIVQRLLDAGANVNAVGEFGKTPLRIAASRGYQKTVQKLLNADAYVDAADDLMNRTPLYMAASGGHSEVVQLLLYAGAKTHAIDGLMGETPLHIAAKQGHLEVVRQLLRAHADIDTFGDSYQTPLHIAANQGHSEIVQVLLGAAVYIDVRDRLVKRTPLHIAADQGHSEVVQQLLDAGANINAVDESKHTPLHIAVRQSYEEIVKILLHKGADLTLTDDIGFTPFQAAFNWGFLGIVQAFAAHNTESMKEAALQKTLIGETALHILCYWALPGSGERDRGTMLDEETVCQMFDELLRIAPGIDLNAENEKGFAPLDLAVSVRGGYDRFIRKLVEKGAKPASEEGKRTFQAWEAMGDNEESDEESWYD